VAIRRKFRDQAAAKQARSSRDKNFHCDSPFVSGFRMDRMAPSRICSRTAEVGGAVLRKRHPRFMVQFTPTSSSWMNLVERFFADLTEDVIRAGSFASVGELVRHRGLPCCAQRQPAPLSMES
jgi:hypothetical protein